VKQFDHFIKIKYLLPYALKAFISAHSIDTATASTLMAKYLQWLKISRKDSEQLVVKC
jgi:hypothetical protein